MTEVINNMVGLDIFEGRIIMNRIWCLFFVLLLMSQVGRLSARQVVTFENLNTPGYAEDISPDGNTIIGNYLDDNVRSWIWQSGEITTIEEFRVNAMSDDLSIIVGYVPESPPDDYPFLLYGEAAYLQEGTITPIGWLPGDESSECGIISGDGTLIAGSCGLSGRAFVYKDGVMTHNTLGYITDISFDGSIQIGFNPLVIPWLNMEGLVYVGNNAWGGNIPPWPIPSHMSDDASVMAGPDFYSFIGGGASTPFRLVDGEYYIPLDEPEGFSPNGVWEILDVSGDGKVIVGQWGHYMPGNGWMNNNWMNKILWREEDGWMPIDLDLLLEEQYPTVDPSQLDDLMLNRDGSVIVAKYMEQTTCRVILLNMFGHYSVQQGIAETGSWLGRVYAKHDPWIWCEKTSSWLYFPEETTLAEQGWVFATDLEGMLIVQVPGTDWGYSFALEEWLYMDGSGWVFMM